MSSNIAHFDDVFPSLSTKAPKPPSYNGNIQHFSFYRIDGKDELELHNYHESTEWKLTSSKAVKKLIKYPCCENPFVGK